MRILDRLEHLERRGPGRRGRRTPITVELCESEVAAFDAAHPPDPGWRIGDPIEYVLIILPDEEGHAEEL